MKVGGGGNLLADFVLQEFLGYGHFQLLFKLSYIFDSMDGMMRTYTHTHARTHTHCMYACHALIYYVRHV